MMPFASLHLADARFQLTTIVAKISRAQYALPQWITLPQKKIILRILDPSPITVTLLEALDQYMFLITSTVI
uniref:Uncharacterized protein n=1 Tax=Aegilops tauschii subsp. strangulata TaxID=200361 RepID=A0A453NJN9_AEGTS